MTLGVIYASFIRDRKSKLESFARNSADFSRSRKLNLVHLVGHILHMVCSRNANGYAITSQNYFSELGMLSGEHLMGTARSSFCEARQKLDWRAFEYLHKEAVISRDELTQEELWKDHAVYAFDGTKITLPNSKEIISQFPQRKATRSSKGVVSHYPFAVMVSACNLYTGQPVAARVMNMHGSERDSVVSMLSEFESGNIFLLDRGLDGIRVWKPIQNQKQFYVSRLRVSKKYKRVNYVAEFIRTGKKEAVITKQFKDPQTKEWIPHKMRLIRGRKLKDGSILVIGTNLFDKGKYPANAILKLYSKRWTIETMYAQIKTLLAIQNFHARTVNGLYQEIFANLLVLSMTAAIALRAAKMRKLNMKKLAPNFKNATEVLKRNLFICTGSVPLTRQKLKVRARWIIDQVVDVVCKKQNGRSNPRYSRQPVNRWAFAKASKILAHQLGRRANESRGMRNKYKSP